MAVGPRKRCLWTVESAEEMGWGLLEWSRRWGRRGLEMGAHRGAQDSGDLNIRRREPNRDDGWSPSMVVVLSESSS